MVEGLSPRVSPQMKGFLQPKKKSLAWEETCPHVLKGLLNAFSAPRMEP